MKSPDPREANLPKWARQQLSILRSDLLDTTERLKLMQGDIQSPIRTWDLEHPSMYFDPHQGFEFRVGDHERDTLIVSLDHAPNQHGFNCPPGRMLNVRGMIDGIVIYPAASNSVLIGTKK